jgi:ribosomal protein S18 acetylase RimI-like enzyme
VEIQFRPAGPADVDEAIPLIYNSGPHEIDYVLGVTGPAALDFLRLAFIAGTGTFGHQIYVVATIDDKIVGGGAFCSGEQFSRRSLRTSRQIFQYFGPRKCWAVFKRGLLLSTVLPPPDKHTEFITQLAVDPANQGHGIGTALLLHEINKARLKQRHCCTLDVLTTNLRAKQLYHRLGFNVVWDRKFSHPDIPGFYRMELTL